NTAAACSSIYCCSSGWNPAPTAVAVGPGSGKRRLTSGVWRFMQRFEPPDQKGRNVKCIATIKLPPSAGGQLPARTRVCGALFKQAQTNRSAQVSGTGTTGLKNYTQKCHPSEFAMLDEGRASKAVKNERGTILAAAGDSKTAKRGPL
ncbi:unnamed protein product, partial [Pylaiella littoralis]